MRANSASIDMIAVLLPVEAEGREISGGRTTDPPELFHNGGVRFYPAHAQIGIDTLEIRYRIPATEQQKEWIEFLTKLFATVVVPLSTVLWTRATDRAVEKRRRNIIIGGG